MNSLQALALSFSLSLAAAVVGCASPTSAEDDGVDESTGDALTSKAVVTITASTITQASGADVLRRVPGEQVAFKNVTTSTKRLVLSRSNVIRGNADYAQATKIDVPAGATVVFGTSAHPLPAGATFVGFDSPSLKSGWREFARLAVWVGPAVNRACDVTLKKLGTDSCPAWGMDADFCSCTPALPGGG